MQNVSLLPVPSGSPASVTFYKDRDALCLQPSVVPASCASVVSSEPSATGAEELDFFVLVKCA